MDVLYGLHPIEEAVRANPKSLDHVLIARERKDERLETLARECREAGVRVMTDSRQQLTRIAGTETHQGAVAMVKERKLLALEDLIGRPNTTPSLGAGHQFLLALDGVEDPHNLGALLRTCDGAGVNGVVLDGAAVGAALRGGCKDLGGRGGACTDCAGDEPCAGA